MTPVEPPYIPRLAYFVSRTDSLRGPVHGDPCQVSQLEARLDGLEASRSLLASQKETSSRLDALSDELGALEKKVCLSRGGSAMASGEVEWMRASCLAFSRIWKGIKAMAAPPGDAMTVRQVGESSSGVGTLGEKVAALGDQIPAISKEALLPELEDVNARLETLEASISNTVDPRMSKTEKSIRRLAAAAKETVKGATEGVKGAVSCCAGYTDGVYTRLCRSAGSTLDSPRDHPYQLSLSPMTVALQHQTGDMLQRLISDGDSICN
jgi:hypothetical protein